MAKQSGLHQIRGKVGEHSYYRQTGVVSGLIRSINQGMSSRVKTSDEYANTRLNNAEFGQAGRIAKVCGRLIVPKFRPMTLPFSQSKMAKILLSYIKTDVAPWGQRNIPSISGSRIQSLLDAINSVSKGDFDTFGFEFSRDDQQEIVITPADPAFGDRLAAIGANGSYVRVGFASPLIGLYDSDTGEYVKSFARCNYSDHTLGTSGNEISVAENFPIAPPVGGQVVAVNFLVVIIMPFKTINGENHILQEYCTFKAVQAPAP